MSHPLVHALALAVCGVSVYSAPAQDANLTSCFDCPFCMLPCMTGSCTNMWIDVLTEDECNIASQRFGCGRCMAAAVGREVLLAVGKSSGFVTPCTSPLPPQVEYCPLGLMRPGEPCTHPADCAIPPGLSHSVCNWQVNKSSQACQSGQSGALCASTSDCVLPHGLKHPVCIKEHCRGGRKGDRCGSDMDCIHPVCNIFTNKCN
mmetsp:Transcript_45194/g.118636  ORF Transcript_45194/g.118636 Transcript_45194/m.118636 type:complete len:204 (+) Transcript_45194:109-720(+)